MLEKIQLQVFHGRHEPCSLVESYSKTCSERTVTRYKGEKLYLVVGLSLGYQNNREEPLEGKPF